MTKRIISSLLAALLILASIVIFCIAVQNVFEFVVEFMASRLGEVGFDGWSDFYLQSICGEDFRIDMDEKGALTFFYLWTRFKIWLERTIPNFGIGMKFVVSSVLFCLAIFVVSYKETKIWSIVRKTSGVLTSLSLSVFIFFNLLSVFVKSLWMLIFGIGSLINLFWSLSYFNFFKYFWRISFTNVMTIIFLIAIALLIAYVLYLSFKKDLTPEEKEQRKIKKDS